jgi:hypothetical protein
MDQQYFKDDVVIKVSIMDKRWNNNNDMWNDLLKCLYSLKKSNEY